MHCKQCGEDLIEGARFCTNCGMVIEENDTEFIPSGMEYVSETVSAVQQNQAVTVDTIPEDSFLKKDSPINAIVSKFHSLPRNTKIVMVVVFAIILVLMVVAISNSSSKLVGKWDNGDVGYIMFTSDGQYFIDNDSISGTYKVDGSTLIMIRNSNGRMSQCTYKISDDILTITYPDGDTVAFFRSK